MPSLSRMRTPTPLLLRLCCYFCLAQVCFSLSQQRNLPTTNFDGGPVVNLVYFCTLRQTSGKTCEETAVSIYSMSLMLSPQRSITDTRDIHVSVVSNAECRSCLAPKIEALQVQKAAVLALSPVLARTMTVALVLIQFLRLFVRLCC